MKLYTIIGGVNGCGKSSLTGALKAERSDLGLLIDVDKLAAQLGSPVEGGKAAVRKIDECLEKGISFTQENHPVRREDGTHHPPGQGTGVPPSACITSAWTPMEESLGRIANRVAKGGHDIPKADVERRFQSRFTDVLRVLPYCDEARFFDNDNGFVEVAEYRNGELIPRVSNPPRWLLELMERVD